MRAALINENRIVENVIIVNNLSDYPGALECPDWVCIGMSIDEPMPVFYYSAEYNKNKAVELLKETDWVNQPDVYDTNSAFYLANRDEFLSYRSFLRQIAVYPVEGNLDWMTVPVAVWAKKAE